MKNITKERGQNDYSIANYAIRGRWLAEDLPHVTISLDFLSPSGKLFNMAHYEYYHKKWKDNFPLSAVVS